MVKIDKTKLWYRYGVLIFSLFISSLVFNLLLYPTDLVTGGLNGVAIILNHIIDISPSLVILVGSLILLGLSYLFLGSYFSRFTYFIRTKLFISRIRSNSRFSSCNPSLSFICIPNRTSIKIYCNRY